MDSTRGLPAISAAVTPASAAPVAASHTERTATQKQALSRLHAAAQQFEAVFVDMLFKEMRKNAPPTSLTGKPSNADGIFADMLDEKRSEAVAQTGSLGIGKIIEEQYKSAVLANPSAESKTRVPTEGDL
jgi:peptidoglycan hydrolase FlgJ